MSEHLSISQFLDDVHDDWNNSKQLYSNNIFLHKYWPLPFFGNPAKATVATVGVNPSSGEFTTERKWDAVDNKWKWKVRLRDYFNIATPPHPWFESWSKFLNPTGVSYVSGTAAHIDVSYRPTRAMLKNKRTDPQEFRAMIERDVQWLFQLLPVCPKVHTLLVCGPIVRANGKTEPLMSFILKSGPQHGFPVLPDGSLKHLKSGRVYLMRDVLSDRQRTPP